MRGGIVPDVVLGLCHTTDLATRPASLAVKGKGEGKIVSLRCPEFTFRRDGGLWAILLFASHFIICCLSNIVNTKVEAKCSFLY